MDRILLLGCGNVGSYIVRTLNNLGISLSIADTDYEKLRLFEEYNDIYKLDVSDKDKLTNITRGFEWVVTSLPGYIAYDTVKTLINMGKNIIDVSFYPEDPWQLDKLAREKNSIYIPDAGFAPGISNIIVGYLYTILGGLDEVDIYVGGLSFEPNHYLGLALTWSPIDLIEEYIRPARMIIDGMERSIKPLEYTGNIEIPGIGEFEFFASDGLRTMLKTFADIKRMRELTIRYKGHIEIMKALEKVGLLSDDKISVDGVEIRLSQVLASLFTHKIANKYRDKAILYIYGKKNDNVHRAFYFLEYDPERKISAMAMATGSTCVSILLMALKGEISNIGVYPPEYIGLDTRKYNIFIRRLSELGIRFRIV
jgi:saccharopine dehydrogenase-like NADP-dependent oxidoreductase